MIQLIQGDCLETMKRLGRFDCIFADPPDNIGTAYNNYKDKQPNDLYCGWLNAVVHESARHSHILWCSVNARWSAEFGAIIERFRQLNPEWCYRHCEQVFTFGQHSHTWLGNNHRPLWCLYHKDARFYPDNIRVPSWRQLHGDKRADPRGRVPGDVFDMQYPDVTDDPSLADVFTIGWYLSAALEDSSIDPAFRLAINTWFETHPGDVFDFPRVTGNSKQRCDWHPTQLHEDLVERVIRFSTADHGSVLDPFAGTATTARVAGRSNRSCTLIESDSNYCAKIADAHGLENFAVGVWHTRNEAAA